MLIKAEVFVNAKEANEHDAMWSVMHSLASLAASQNKVDIVRVRMPDSPEPDISGTIKITK